MVSLEEQDTMHTDIDTQGKFDTPCHFLQQEGNNLWMLA